MLGSHGEPIHMDWNGHYDLGAAVTSIPTQAVGCESGLDAFPLGATILEPYFHLKDKLGKVIGLIFL